MIPEEPLGRKSLEKECPIHGATLIQLLLLSGQRAIVIRIVGPVSTLQMFLPIMFVYVEIKLPIQWYRRTLSRNYVGVGVCVEEGHMSIVFVVIKWIGRGQS
jgi:hypothetical protein